MYYLSCKRILIYLHNWSNVVSARLDCFSADPTHESALPPNVVTSVTPSTRQKAVVEWHQRGCRVSLTWRDREGNKFKEAWLVCVSHTTPYLRVWYDVVKSMNIQSHLPPPPTVLIQNPGISQYLALSVHSPSDQQLWVLLAIVKTTSSMGWPLFWPRPTFWHVEFGAVLESMTVTSWDQRKGSKSCSHSINNIIKILHCTRKWQSETDRVHDSDKLVPETRKQTML